MKIRYRIINIVSNTSAPWACRVYAIANNAPNLWFFYKTRKQARNKLKIHKINFNENWFKKAMS